MKTEWKFSESSFLYVNISFTPLIVNWISLGCSQNKTFEDVMLVFGNSIKHQNDLQINRQLKYFLAFKIEHFNELNHTK